MTNKQNHSPTPQLRKNIEPLFELGMISVLVGDCCILIGPDNQLLAAELLNHCSGEHGCIDDLLAQSNKRAIKRRQGSVISVFPTEEDAIHIGTHIPKTNLWWGFDGYSYTDVSFQNGSCKQAQLFTELLFVDPSNLDSSTIILR